VLLELSSCIQEVMDLALLIVLLRWDPVEIGVGEGSRSNKIVVIPLYLDLGLALCMRGGYILRSVLFSLAIEEMKRGWWRGVMHRST
jgi:hypothetical protein